MSNTLDTLAAELRTLADAIEGPEEWGYNGFYAANFGIQATERHQLEALIDRLEPLTAREDVTCASDYWNIDRESVAYTIGENSSIGLEIRVTGPIAPPDRQARIAELEAELTTLKAAAAEVTHA